MKGLYVLEKLIDPRLLDNCKGASKVSIEWLDKIRSATSAHIQHLNNGGEYQKKSVKYLKNLYKFDGYDSSTNTVYEFHGCYWHGCPMCFKQNSVNPTTRTKFSTLYYNTVARENDIKSMGYNLVVIWGCDYSNAMKNNERYTDYHRSGSIPIKSCEFRDFLNRIEDC
jgi:hypothetical protein